MKIYMASFLQPQNFGPGRVISIAQDKPEHIDPEPLVFVPLVPDPQLTYNYNKRSQEDPKSAGAEFRDGFKKQLDDFYNEVIDLAEKKNITPQEVLPFEEGDTLASWHRAEFTNYRKMIYPYLEKLGYEVVKN